MLRLKELRSSKGLTQSELADLCGLRLGEISKIERGQTNPKLSTLYSLMDGLNCSPNEIFGQCVLSRDLLLLKSRFESLPDENKRVLLFLIDKVTLGCKMP
nr:helix-turn-helix transcriptional regulator [uncultured Vibrio sp.]